MRSAKYIEALAGALGVGDVRRRLAFGTATVVVAAMVGSVTAAPSVPPVSPTVQLSADSTALLLAGTGASAWNPTHVQVIMDRYVNPTHPGSTIAPVAVTAPMETWPITGVFRILGYLLGDPSIGGPGGEFWPDEPLWKLSGLFDMTGDQSIAAGVVALEQATADNPSDHLVIYGYSLGAVVAVAEKRKLAEQYPDPATAPDIDFVLGGDVAVPNGGFGARFPGLYIPILDWSYVGAEPTNTPFDTTVITRQYDGFADFPLYPLNLVATLNAVLGLFYVHTWPFEVSLAPDATTTPYVVSSHGDSTYYLFETQDLPLFGPLRSLGVPEQLIDVVEPAFRVLVELGYDRSIPQWQPTPARLFPTTLDLGEVATDLVSAIGEGMENAGVLVGAPPSDARHGVPLSESHGEPSQFDASGLSEVEAKQTEQNQPSTDVAPVPSDPEATTEEGESVVEDDLVGDRSKSDPASSSENGTHTPRRPTPRPVVRPSLGAFEALRHFVKRRTHEPSPAAEGALADGPVPDQASLGETPTDPPADGDTDAE